jgi:protoporphyrinogen oxidase
MKREKLAVVGGGVSGISAALELAKSGKFEVSLFEKEAALGGLWAPTAWDDLVCDKFYHVVLPGDGNTLAFLSGLGLGSEVEGRPAKAGFYGRGRIVPFSGALDLIRFPFLDPFEKARLVLGVRRVARGRAASGEGLSAPDWLRRVFGESVAARFWEPLLRSKLGGAGGRTPAAFMEATIRRLYGARVGAGKRERMAFVRGGAAAVVRAAGQLLVRTGVDVRTAEPVSAVSIGEGGFELALPRGPERFHKVVLGVPGPEALRLLWPVAAGPAWDGLRREYLGVVCVLAVLGRSLSPYYVLNLLDPSLPFTGIIESTNVIGTENAAGRSLVYLPKYLSRDDPAAGNTPAEIEKSFLEALKKIFPALTDRDIVHVRTFREPYIQPLPGFGPLPPDFGPTTPVPGLFLAGSAALDGSMANNEAALGTAKRAAAAALASVR